MKSSGTSFIKQHRETILTFEYRDTRFQNLKIDQCIYVFEDEDGSKMIWAHYVDDIICGTTNRELNCVKTSSNIFVGVGILRTRVNSIGFLVLTSDAVMTKRNGQLQPQHTLIVLSVNTGRSSGLSDIVRLQYDLISPTRCQY